MNQDLLKPSLGDDAIEPIYSPGALMAAAFFGGGFAITALAGANMRRLNRLSSEWPWLVLGALASVVVIYVTMHLRGDGADQEGNRDVRIAVRATGFVLWGLFYYLHRERYRALQTFGLPPPSPWVPVILALVFSTVCTLFVVRVAMLYPLEMLL